MDQKWRRWWSVPGLVKSQQFTKKYPEGRKKKKIYKKGTELTGQANTKQTKKTKSDKKPWWRLARMLKPRTVGHFWLFGTGLVGGPPPPSPVF